MPDLPDDAPPPNKTPSRLREGDHPFYKPLWRRLAIVGGLVAWSIYEGLYVRDGFWSVIAVGMLGYAIWMFLIDFGRERPGK